MVADAAGLRPPGTAKMPHRIARPPRGAAEDHMQPEPSGLSTTLRQQALASIATFPGGPGGPSHLRTAAAMVAAGGEAPAPSVHVAPADAVGKADHVLPRQLQGGNEFVSHTGSEVGCCCCACGGCSCGAGAAAALGPRL